MKRGARRSLVQVVTGDLRSGQQSVRADNSRKMPLNIGIISAYYAELRLKRLLSLIKN